MPKERFYGFFGDFELRDTFQERIALKSIEIDIEKLRMKFSALNVDFDGPSLDFLGSRKPAHEGIKKKYPSKSRYFTTVGQFFVKTIAYLQPFSRQTGQQWQNCLQIGIGMLPTTTSTSDELSSRINIDDFERP